MSRKHVFIKGVFILTITGFISRFIGFFQRVFLSQVFGAEGMGLYQLIFPVYAMAYSLCVAGIETAISRTTSRKLALGESKSAREFFYISTTLSLLGSIIIALLIQQNTETISTLILNDSRTIDLILIASYALPFSALHSCIVGYYFGCKKTEIPSIAQLIEQVVRVGSIYFLYMFCQANDSPYSISLAVIGLVLGEFISALFCIFSYTHLQRKEQSTLHFSPKSIASHLKELFCISTPLTGNRVALNLLHSVEAISIPSALILYGLTNSEAISMFGVLTGMALPCILFPTAITSSVSTMLLPTIAETDARQDKKQIKQILQKSVSYNTLLGLICLIFFLVSSNLIGELLFHSSLASEFIRTLAWLCPFLYLNTNLLTIINGLGKTIFTFILNAVGLSIRIGSIFLFIPLYGIQGYLWGVLCSQIFITLGSALILKRLCSN